MRLTLGEVAAAVDGQLVRGDRGAVVTGARYDKAEAVRPNDILFLPGSAPFKEIKLRLAVSRQVLAVVTDRYWTEQPTGNYGWIKVKNCVRAFWKLVRCWRERINPITVAVTGSTGKTTTKEAVAAVLSQNYCVHKTADNLNMIKFVPQHIFQIQPEHHFAVWETGIKRRGELSRMCRYIQPQIGIITNIGFAHSGKLGGISNTIRAKGELVRALPQDGLLFINCDNEYSKYLPRFCGQTVTFGMGESADIQATGVCYNERGMRFTVTFRDSSYTYHLPLFGIHNVYNALPAVGLGLMYNTTPEQIQNGLNSISLPAFRWQVSSCPNQVVIVNDAYNASPESVRAGLSTFMEVYRKQCCKIAVLGEMLELGKYAAEAHYQLGVFAAGLELDKVVAVGPAAHYIALGISEAGFVGPVYHCTHVEEALDLLQELIKPGAAVFIKGSHDTGLFHLGDRLAAYCRRNSKHKLSHDSHKEN